MLRDTELIVGGAAETLIRGFQLNFNNQLRPPEFDAKICIEDLLDGANEYRLWHPARIKRGRRRTFGGRLMFHEPKTVLERRQDMAALRTFVAETEAQALGTTPAANEMFRFTAHRMVLTGGGASNMTRDDDITSDFEFGAYINPALAQAVKFEFVDATAGALAFT